MVTQSIGICQSVLSSIYGANSPPARKNLEFLLGLRNKIEHRHLPELDSGLYGECQAAPPQFLKR